MLLDPIVNATEVWLAIYSWLPIPVRALFELSFFIFLVMLLFHVIYRIRS